MSTLQSTPLKVKVLIITTYEYLELDNPKSSGEAYNWYYKDNLKNFLPIPGTFGGSFDENTPDGYYQGVFHSDSGEECLVVTGMGQNNACSTLMALGTSDLLDLTEAYLLVAGIAGGNPNHIGLGSVAWANWTVAGDLANLVTLNELSADQFLYPLFHLGCYTPWPDNQSGNQGYTTGTEIFPLNQELAGVAHSLSAKAQLAQQSDSIMQYVSQYDQPAAQSAPAVLRGDSIASNNFYHGRVLGEWAEWWMKQWTNQWIADHTEESFVPGIYTTSLMEDVGFATAAKRLDSMGRVQFNRMMQLRGVGNFDRPYPGQMTLASLKESDAVEIAFDLALDNLYNAGSVVVKEILKNWERWRNGPPECFLD